MSENASTTYPYGRDYDYERQSKLDNLRRAALAAAMRVTAEYFTIGRGTTVAPAREAPFDEACKALADKLREPKTCHACQQEVK